MQRKGLLVVLSAPSGGGKTTIFRKLLERNPHFEYSVSATTRPARTGEIDGRDYNFMSHEEFSQLVEQKQFAEWAIVHENRYGTLRSIVDTALDNDKTIIFDIDVQGAEQLNQTYPHDCVLIFIMPPSRIELEKRLRIRATDTHETIALRMKNADGEVSRANEYHYIVLNDNVENAITTVEAIIKAESAKFSRNRDLITNWCI